MYEQMVLLKQELARIEQAMRWLELWELHFLPAAEQCQALCESEEKRRAQASWQPLNDAVPEIVCAELQFRRRAEKRLR